MSFDKVSKKKTAVGQEPHLEHDVQTDPDRRPVDG